jgi:fatty acid desaturase
VPVDFTTPKLGPFLISLAIATLVALFVFRHASTHGSAHPTAWGIAAFLFAGFVVPLYFIRYWLIRSRQR